MNNQINNIIIIFIDDHGKLYEIEGNESFKFNKLGKCFIKIETTKEIEL